MQEAVSEGIFSALNKIFFFVDSIPATPLHVSSPPTIAWVRMRKRLKIFKILSTFSKRNGMSVNEYKESIRHLIDITDDEVLLQHWKKQLEWDVEHQHDVTLSDEEWNLVEEGLADYEKGEVISLEGFISKRK